MELRQLRYFVTVAEELHFGRAAHRLHIVQPAVSQQVRRLERELGVALFDRSPRQVRLTGHGKRLLPEARAVLAAADRTVAVAAGLAGAHGGALRIGTSRGLGARLEAGLDALRRLAPDIELRLDSRPVAEQVDAVRSGELDFAFVRAATTRPGLRVVEVWRDSVPAVLPASHPLANSDPLGLPELADVSVRLPPRQCEPLLHELVLRACRNAGFEPREDRPAGTVEDTLIELGAGPPAWMPLFGEHHLLAGRPKVKAVTLSPPLEVPTSLVLSAERPLSCVQALCGAFAGRSEVREKDGAGRVDSVRMRG